MRKWFIISGLFISFLALGQRFPMASSAHLGAGTGYTEQFQAVLDEWTVDPTGDTLTWFDDFCYSWDTAGFWDRTDLMYCIASKNRDNAGVNFISPGNYTIDDGDTVTYTLYRGWTGDGNDYLPTGFNPGDGGSYNFQQDSATVGVYILDGVNDNRSLYASYNSQRIEFIINSSGQTQGVLNSATAGGITYVTDETSGLFLLVRGQGRIEIYANGISNDQEADASTGIPNDNIDLLADVVHSVFSTETIAFFFVMDGLTDTEAAIANTIIETLMDHLGCGVQ